jgi:hypothetical protein
MIPSEYYNDIDYIEVHWYMLHLGIRLTLFDTILIQYYYITDLTDRTFEILHVITEAKSIYRKH